MVVYPGVLTDPLSTLLTPNMIDRPTRSAEAFRLGAHRSLVRPRGGFCVTPAGELHPAAAKLSAPV